MSLDCPEWFHGELAFEMDLEGWVGLVLKVSRQRPPGECGLRYCWVSGCVKHGGHSEVL